MIESPATDLEINGFTFVKALTETTSFYNFTNGLVKFDPGNADRQVPGSRGYYKNPFFEQLLINLLPLVEQYTGYQLFKTYSYLRLYHPGERLEPHIDRVACEVTVSLCLGSEGLPWPLWIRDRDGKKHSFEMTAGDAVIFKGVELSHWRDVNTFGNCSYVFLHYVNQFGPYADQKDDTLNNRKMHY